MLFEHGACTCTFNMVLVAYNLYLPTGLASMWVVHALLYFCSDCLYYDNSTDVLASDTVLTFPADMYIVVKPGTFEVKNLLQCQIIKLGK